MSIGICDVSLESPHLMMMVAALFEGQSDLVLFAQSKLDGTVWTDVDDSRVFKVLDLEDIEKTFSAYQRQQVTMRCS